MGFVQLLLFSYITVTHTIPHFRIRVRSVQSLRAWFV